MHLRISKKTSVSWPTTKINQATQLITIKWQESKIYISMQTLNLSNAGYPGTFKKSLLFTFDLFILPKSINKKRRHVLYFHVMQLQAK